MKTKEIEKMDGYEFEKLICSLIKKMGFNVKHTKLSGDGGVDIIATSQETFFKGKYLIQCKRYYGSIGEPPIRDLFGVVLHERANKGILITNSTFTESAKRFADGKNIELIDGKGLNELLTKYFDNAPSTSKLLPFYRHSDFNNEKYEYYKNMVAKDTAHYPTLINFLYSYIENKNLEIMFGGLIDEIFGIAKVASEFFDDNGISLFSDISLCLLQGQIEKAFEYWLNLLRGCISNGMLSESQAGVFGRTANIVIGSGATARTIPIPLDNCNSYVKLQNLLTMLNYLGFAEAKEYVQKVLISEPKLKAKINTDIRKKSKMLVDLGKETEFCNTISIVVPKIGLVIGKTNKNKRSYYGAAGDSKIVSFEIKDLIPFWSTDLEKQKQRINFLCSTLEIK